jgi:hypothetical protein
MKKIKLFALAVFAMLSTNAFAQGYGLTSGQKQTIDNLEYSVVSVYNTEDPTTGKINKVSVKANNWTGAALTIDPTVSFTVEGIDDDGKAISKETTFKVVTIEDYGFEGNLKITSVSIPATVEFIGYSAFEECENLATVTLASESYLINIGEGAFAYTSVTKLDLTNATANPNGDADPKNDGMQFYGAWGNPFTSSMHATNLMIKEVVLPTVTTAIGAKSFKDLKNLTTIDLKNVTDIEANAFDGCAKLASVKIATGDKKVVGTIANNAFANCSALATVEFGKIASTSVFGDNVFGGTAEVAHKDPTFTGATYADEEAVIGAGKVVGDTHIVGDIAWNGAAYQEVATAEVDYAPATTIAGVTTFTFNVVEADLSANAFNLATVRTLNFKNYIKTASRIPAGAFTAAFPDATKTNTINYAYTDRGTNELVNAFATKAFSASAVEKIITLITTAEFEGAGYTINKVEIDGGYTTDIIIGNPTTKKLVKDKNSSSYYYFTTLGTGVYKSILRTQEESGATVNVYQAYMDVVDGVATAFFMPVQVKAGKYVIGEGTFIVKSNQEDGVVASTGVKAESTMAYGYDKKPINTLENTEGTAYSVLAVQTDASLMNGGSSDVWFFNNPATSGFGFTKFDAAKQTGGLAKNTVYMVCAATSGARINLVWLDEDGNTTAIQTINKAKADNGAIYNLRGEKVNASYKGLVIKDGKKYIQK